MLIIFRDSGSSGKKMTGTEKNGVKGSQFLTGNTYKLKTCCFLSAFLLLDEVQNFEPTLFLISKKSITYCN